VVRIRPDVSEEDVITTFSLMSLRTIFVGYLLDLVFQPEDGGDMSLRNVVSLNYKLEVLDLHAIYNFFYPAHLPSVDCAVVQACSSIHMNSLKMELL
jgi:hypothetical protein